uniref:hypothetical protein n=1 Tax=Pararhizobium sp. IMCC3301 TaxID=3067904 RepID=UPI0027422581|nr:hypothetical protein [Pararhizobium sp. IMCC3301]
MKPIILGSVLIMLMSAAKAAFPSYLFFLPIGGSVITETGIILSIAVAIATLIDTF